MPAHAQSISANCKQFNPKGNMNCELAPYRFTDWQYTAGYGGTWATEGEAAQNTYATYMAHPDPSVCDISMTVDAERIVNIRAGFVGSDDPIRTTRGMSISWGGKDSTTGACEGVYAKAGFNIIGTRSAQCRPGWTAYYDAQQKGSFCGIYSAPLPAQPAQSPLSCTPEDGLAIGNPILPATGEKRQTEADYVDPGAGGLAFIRTYRSTWGNSNALVRDPSSLGQAWSHNHLTRLDLSGIETLQSAILTTGEGYLRYFMRTASGAAWQPVSGTDTLAQNPDGTWTYRNTEDDSTLSFSAERQLLAHTERNGRSTTYTYNNSGQLTRITDPFGRSLQLTYTGDALTTVTTPDGRLIDYQYDSAGRLSGVTYPDGTHKSYLYENTAYPQALTGLIDEAGVRYASFDYDSQGRAISTEHAGGAQRYQVTYSSATQSYVIDPLGTSRSYNYNTDGNRLTVTSSSLPSANGQKNVTSRTLDANGLVTTQNDFKYTQTRFDWDAARRLPLSVTRGVGKTEQQITTTQWHPSFALPVLITEQDRTTAYTYDAQGNPLTRTVTDTTTHQAQTWQWTYTAQSLVSTQTEPNGAVTQYAYDPLGNLTQTTNALGHVTSYTYDDANRLTSETAPNGLTTTYTYDARDRVLTRSVDTQQTTLTYTPYGQLQTLTLPSGLILTYTYDAAQRLTGWSNNRGESGNYTLDGMGNRLSEQINDASGALAWSTARSVNNINRLTQSTLGPNQTDTFAYDQNGDLTTETNGLNQSTRYGLDALRRVSTITNPANATANLTWNTLDAITQAKDYKSVATTYTRDAQGNPTTENSPDIGARTTQYDALGLPSQIIDALGQATQIQRDALGRPTRLTFADGKETTLRYDLSPQSTGMLSEITDRSGTTQYTRDPLGRITLKRQSLANGLQQQIGYAYTANGPLQSIHYPNGGVLTYQYDPTGRITQLNWNGVPLVTNITWNPLGQPTAWTWALATPVTATRSYDTAGRLTASEFSGYTYDAAGRITSLNQTLYQPGTSATQNWTLTYDPVGRLTGFNTVAGGITNTTASFTYDANGNRSGSSETQNGVLTTRTYTYSNANRPTSLAQKIGAAPTTNLTYTYNPNGDLLNDGQKTYTYDAEGRLASATDTTGTGLTTRYVHNALGQRVLKTDAQNPSHDTAYLYDEDGSLIAETGTGANTSSTVHIYLPTASGPMPIAAIIDGQKYAVHADHLNTPRRLTDDNGLQVWQWAYSAFGDEPTSMAAVIGTPVTYNLRYPGQYYDPESGLHDNYFRSYSPERGSYTQTDPIGLDGGWNRFAYVGGNPVSFIDPLGLQTTVDAAIRNALMKGDIAELESLLEAANPSQAATIRSGIEKFGSRATDWIGRNCKGSINREFPGELRDKTLKEIMDQSKSGDSVAKKAWKLLNDNRFKK
ncbi:MAG: DUF6531 domain-containing protein [Betaproteobacteria bacterium]|nr:DUF6531 domain-containing protein [Betaproteobacteria bacterium]